MGLYLNILFYTTIILKYNSDNSVFELEVIWQNCDEDLGGISIEIVESKMDLDITGVQYEPQQ